MKKALLNFQLRIRAARLRARLVKVLDPAVQKFLVISAPRTGSNLFCGLMTSHPKIICFHEVFHRKGILIGSPSNISSFDLGSAEERDQNPVKFLQKLYSREHGFPAVGMKMFSGHNDIVMLALMQNRDVKKIVVSRRAALHAYSSVLVARQTHAYQNIDESAASKPGRVHIDVDEFRKFADSREKFFSDIRAQLRGQDYRELDYLDIANRTRQFWEVQEFLGLEMVNDLKARLRQQSAGELIDKIANYDELAEELWNTPHERFLLAEALQRQAGNYSK